MWGVGWPVSFHGSSSSCWGGGCWFYCTFFFPQVRYLLLQGGGKKKGESARWSWSALVAWAAELLVGRQGPASSLIRGWVYKVGCCRDFWGTEKRLGECRWKNVSWFCFRPVYEKPFCEQKASSYRAKWVWNNLLQAKWLNYGWYQCGAKLIQKTKYFVLFVRPQWYSLEGCICGASVGFWLLCCPQPAIS